MSPVASLHSLPRPRRNGGESPKGVLPNKRPFLTRCVKTHPCGLIIVRRVTRTREKSRLSGCHALIQRRSLARSLAGLLFRCNRASRIWGQRPRAYAYPAVLPVVYRSAILRPAEKPPIRPLLRNLQSAANNPMHTERLPRSRFDRDSPWFRFQSFNVNSCGPPPGDRERSLLHGHG